VDLSRHHLALDGAPGVPAEQQRIVEILVDQVVVYPDRIEVALAADGLYSIVGEMREQEGCDAE